LVSAGLATLVLSLSVAGPILERGDFIGEAAAESAHDPGRCGHAHDHRICTQVGANLSIVTAVHDHRITHVVLRSRAPATLTSRLVGAFLDGPPSRAPPLV
jgi:hypothetical protein